MEFGVYIHIPFCIQFCGYCDFTKILRKDANNVDLENYQKAIISDISIKLKKISNKANISSIYFGGGTPSLYPVKYIHEIIELLKKRYDFTKNIEITFEIDPKTIRYKSFQELYDAGVNRISIGAQSFDNEILSFLNRYHRKKDILLCYNDARKAGFKNISLDLIFGVPLFTEITWKNDLKELIDLKPEHVSLYSLNIAKNTDFYKRRDSLKLPSDSMYEWSYLYAIKELKKAKIFQYEISNFAKPGFHSVHNQDCWDLKPYIGVGIAASSFYGKKRTENIKNFKKYISKSINGKFVSKSYPLSLKDRQIEFVMLQLRKKCGFKREEYIARFSSQVEEDFPFLFESDISHLISSKEVIKLTQKGMLLSNEVFEKLFW